MDPTNLFDGNIEGFSHIAADPNPPDSSSSPATDPHNVARWTNRQRLQGHPLEWTSSWPGFEHKPVDMTKLPDHWEGFNRISKETDKTMCEGWRDEIEKLLIFAGLFSSVVTAFTIESYQWLQPDPVGTSNLLLEMIAQGLGNSPQNIAVLSSRNSFEPEAWAIRVNITWFLSLSLSLTTALVGILCIQWFREYQRYPSGHHSTKEIFATRQMRFEGLERWHIPEIMAALPLLLQSSLVLFFVGLLDLLWHIQQTVALITSILIGITLLFLVVTTILPTIQFVFYAATLKLVSQYPYKSPQSWVFYRVGVMVAGVLHYVTQPLYCNPLDEVPGSETVSWSDFVRRIMGASDLSDWIEYDNLWRRMRSRLPSRIHEPHIDRQNGLYSLTKSLHQDDKDGCFRVYRCLEDVMQEQRFFDLEVDTATSLILSEMINRVERWWPTLPSLPRLTPAIGGDLLRFLSMLHSPPTLDWTLVLNYKRELFIRMLNSVSANHLRGEPDPGDDGLSQRDGKSVVTRLLWNHVEDLFCTHEDIPIDILIQGFEAVTRKFDHSHGKDIPWLVKKLFDFLFRAVFRLKNQPAEGEGDILHECMSYTCKTVLEWSKDPRHMNGRVKFFTHSLKRDLGDYKDHPFYTIYRPILDGSFFYREAPTSPSS